MKRTELKRKTPLHRKKPMRSTRSTTYAKRPRDMTYMAWIRRQRCTVSLMFNLIKDHVPPETVTLCNGVVEADHLGARALGKKADDRTCAPLCQQHHLERTTFSGAFKNWTQADMREWTSGEIAYYQKLYEDHLRRRP